MDFFLYSIFLFCLYNLPKKISVIYNFQLNVIQRYFGIAVILSIIYLFNIYFLIFVGNSKILNIIIFISIIALGLDIKKIKLYLINIFFFFKKKKFIYEPIKLILIFYYFLSFYPISDLDSLRYHSWIPKQIIDNNFTNVVTFDYIFFGANEIINLFGLNLNFEKISSTINFLYLYGVYESCLYLEKKKIIKNNISIVVILSVPYMISLITSQKLFVLPNYITSFAFIYFFIFFKKKFNKLSHKEFFFIDYSFIFIVTIKISFLPYLILYFIMKCFFLKKIFIKNTILYIFLFIVFFLPIIHFKYLFFNEPFIPFFILNDLNLTWFSIFKEYVLNYSNYDYLGKNLLSVFVPLNFSRIFQSIIPGIIIIFFINYKYKKNILLIVILVIFFFIPILLFNNFQSRWFIPVLILGAILYNRNNKYNYIIEKFYLLYSYIFILILFPISLISISANFNSNLDKIIKKKTVLGYEAIEFINLKYVNKTVITNLENYYYFDKVIPIYSPGFDKKKIYQLSHQNDFFDKNLKINEKFVILYHGNYSENLSQDVENLLKDLNLKNVKVLKHYIEKFHVSGRNFLISTNRDVFHVLECVKFL